MSGIQRYSIYSSLVNKLGFEVKPQDDGEYVKHDDHIKEIEHNKSKEVSLATYDTRKLIPKGMTYYVSEITGMNINTIYGWKKGKMPYLSNFVAAANALGYEVVMRKKGE